MKTNTGMKMRTAALAAILSAAWILDADPDAFVAEMRDL
jgi:hypothetical protein